MNDLNLTQKPSDKRMSIASVRFSNERWSDTLDDAGMVLQSAAEQIRFAACQEEDTLNSAAIFGTLYLVEIGMRLCSLGYEGARAEIHELKAKIAQLESERV